MKYTEALKLFVAEDGYLKWMDKPFTIDDKAYGATTYMVAFADKDLVDPLTELIGDKKESVLKITPKEKNINFSFPVSRLESVFSALPLVDEENEKQCSECDGMGEVEYEYTSSKGRSYELEGDCPICNGTGDIVTKTGGKVKDLRGVIKIGDSCFLLQRFKVMMEAAKVLGEENITLVFKGRKEGVSVFEVGKLTIVTMPTRMESDEETPKIVDTIQII